MVRKRRTKRRKAAACAPGSKTKYKKCLIAKIRGTKITTMKSARRAFRAAAKKCRPILGVVKRRGGRKKKGRRKRSKVPWMTRVRRR